ncbi:MAG TPA: hypothetical protein VHH72_05265 [Solirubrobacterales bacterium]|jgi:hypothetical protein|nr:hypothetical protein [Solirubrobacterales bacterium]
MKTASRTLVKSPPELWEMLDQPERMEGLMSALVGYATEIQIAEREPGERLVWESHSHLDPARIEVEIVESGWGTQIEVSAECASPQRLAGWLDAVMEELATPEKRPFDGIV